MDGTSLFTEFISRGLRPVLLQAGRDTPAPKILYAILGVYIREIADQLLYNTIILLSSSSRDVVRSGLSFIKVYMFVTNKQCLNVNLQKLVITLHILLLLNWDFFH